jgi:hypothetical protein
MAMIQGSQPLSAIGPRQRALQEGKIAYVKRLLAQINHPVCN